MPLQFKPASLGAAKLARYEKPSDYDPLALVKYTGNAEADNAAEVTALQQAFRDRQKAEEFRRKKATDSEYWICVCFQSREQVEEFLDKSGWGRDDAKYVDGQKVAESIGISLTPEDSREYSKLPRIDKVFAELAD